MSLDRLENYTKVYRVQESVTETPENYFEIIFQSEQLLFEHSHADQEESAFVHDFEIWKDFLKKEKEKGRDKPSLRRITLLISRIS